MASSAHREAGKRVRGILVPTVTYIGVSVDLRVQRHPFVNVGVWVRIPVLRRHSLQALGYFRNTPHAIRTAPPFLSRPVGIWWGVCANSCDPLSKCRIPQPEADCLSTLSMAPFTNNRIQSDSSSRLPWFRNPGVSMVDFV